MLLLLLLCLMQMLALLGCWGKAERSAELEAKRGDPLGEVMKVMPATGGGGSMMRLGEGKMSEGASIRRRGCC